MALLARLPHSLKAVFRSLSVIQSDALRHKKLNNLRIKPKGNARLAVKQRQKLSRIPRDLSILHERGKPGTKKRGLGEAGLNSKMENGNARDATKKRERIQSEGKADKKKY
jgi:hypothetical protein